MDLVNEGLATAVSVLQAQVDQLTKERDQYRSIAQPLLSGGGASAPRDLTTNLVLFGGDLSAEEVSILASYGLRIGLSYIVPEDVDRRGLFIPCEPGTYLDQLGYGSVCEERLAQWSRFQSLEVETVKPFPYLVLPADCQVSVVDRTVRLVSMMGAVDERLLLSVQRFFEDVYRVVL